ncbi:MAG: 4'-phosphopantetheinyl transferase superfamily protein [Kiritimatiellae bacterium]|nr:4'-phosphopantetheinyl transferase superfamily protein [Kiritimatiellia bacterium]
MNADLSESFSTELILLGAVTDADLAESATRLVRFLDQAPGVPLRDVAFTCSKKFPAEHKAVLAIVARTHADLRARLVSAAARIQSGSARIRDRSGTYYFRQHLLGEGLGKLAFIYPGATSFYPDMLRDLAVFFRECRLPFDELEAALAGEGKFQPSDFIFPPASYYRHDADVFSAGAYAETVVSTYTANAAMSRLMDTLGVHPDGATGFVGGDLNALAAGGVYGKKFDRKRRLEFLRDMYKVVNNAVSHQGLPTCVFETVIAPRPGLVEEALKAFAPEQVQQAFVLSPKQSTIAIVPEAVDDVTKALAAVGVRSMRLDVDRPFNTPWCKKILSLVHKFASHWVDQPSSIPVYSCVSTQPLPPKARKVRDEVAGQWVEPVKFCETIRRMHADGFRVFLEVGPRGVLTSMIDEILRGEEHAALATDTVHRDGILQVQNMIGQLAALGQDLDPTPLFAHRRPRELDFDAPLSLEVRSETELRLSREFPRLSLSETNALLGSVMASAADSTPGTRKKAAERRAEAAAARERKMRQQFIYGTTSPLVADADVVDLQPGIREVVKTFTFKDAPFLADFAIGAAEHVAFSDAKLHGLVLLHPVVAAEIMAEVAQALVPNRRVAVVEDLQSRHPVSFDEDRLRLFIRAERTASDDPSLVAVHVQIREDRPNAQWTWCAFEATLVFAQENIPPPAFVQPPLNKPRDVHWVTSEIYPDRLYSGRSLQWIRSANRWSESGLDYEVEVPAGEGAVPHTKFPIWALNPQLFAAIADGFQLWRSHENRFSGALSFPFRVRRIECYAPLKVGMHLNCYLRNTGVTPKSLVTDILVSDGNGQLALALRGYEEITERVSEEFRQQLLNPAMTFLSQPLPAELLGEPETQIASAMVSDVPYPVFERNEELWLRTLSQVVLNKTELGDFASISGSVSRRTEWLFGRLVAKEAVRRFLHENYQARWCDADIQVWRDDSGKPHAIGRWRDYLTAPLDITIAHTAQFVVAVVGTNARVGIDVEVRDRDLSEEFTRGVFTDEERDLTLRAASAPSAAIRFWCAKEAVSKALGTGIRYSPRELIVETFQAETGEMTVKLTGQWLESFKQFTGRSIRVSSTVVKGHVLATCFIPESLFG